MACWGWGGEKKPLMCCTQILLSAFFKHLSPHTISCHNTPFWLPPIWHTILAFPKAVAAHFVLILFLPDAHLLEPIPAASFTVGEIIIVRLSTRITARWLTPSHGHLTAQPSALNALHSVAHLKHRDLKLHALPC